MADRTSARSAKGRLHRWWMLFIFGASFDVDKFVEKCENLLKVKSSVVITVSEGSARKTAITSAKWATIRTMWMLSYKQLTGTARYLAALLAAKLGCKTRSIELSTLQRSASHCASRVDILEAYEVGGAAMRLRTKAIPVRWS